MSEETYNGWTNRETWAVALHINNDQGWQEDVFEAIRARIADSPDPDNDESLIFDAGVIIHELMDEALTWEGYSDLGGSAEGFCTNILPILSDIGSMWRVNWTELGASFLSDLEEMES